MRLLIKKLFLTIVLTLAHKAHALPQTTGSIPAIDPRESLQQDIENFELNQNIYFSKKTPQHLGFHIGAIFGPMIEKNKVITDFIFGLRYNEIFSSGKSWEGGINLSGNSLVEIHLGEKMETSFNYNLKSFQKISFSNFLDASAGAATFIDLQKIQAKYSIGFDNLANSSDKYYTEAGLGVSLIGYQIFILFGTQFGIDNLSKK